MKNQNNLNGVLLHSIMISGAYFVFHKCHHFLNLYTTLSLLLMICFIIEIFFYWFIKRQYIDREFGVAHLPPMNEETMAKLISEILSSRSTPNGREFLEGWFKGNKIENIAKMEIKEWIASMCCNKKYHQITEKEMEIGEAFFIAFEQLLEHKFQDDAPPCEKILLTAEPLFVIHRPLFVYLSIHWADLAAQSILSCIGFKKIYNEHIITHYRIVHSDKTPIVFFHGLGIGLAQYCLFLNYLLKSFPERTIILFEMPSVSMKIKISHCIPEDFGNSVVDILNKFNINSVIAIGHSLGTVMVRWLDRFHPEIIEQRIFLDPICFNLWTHHTTDNIFTRVPSGWFQYFLRYFITSEPGIALYLRRYFVWYENTYFSMDLPENSVIYIAENDDIINAHNVNSYLKRFNSESRKVILVNQAAHGDFILYPKYIKQICSKILKTI
jgi:pimeloyl-ACP methyl ester carboxylesterase/uncharacterized protein YneF (UPF0154 family)